MSVGYGKLLDAIMYGSSEDHVNERYSYRYPWLVSLHVDLVKVRGVFRREVISAVFRTEQSELK